MGGFAHSLVWPWVGVLRAWYGHGWVCSGLGMSMGGCAHGLGGQWVGVLRAWEASGWVCSGLGRPVGGCAQGLVCPWVAVLRAWEASGWVCSGLGRPVGGCAQGLGGPLLCMPLIRYAYGQASLCPSPAIITNGLAMTWYAHSWRLPRLSRPGARFCHVWLSSWVCLPPAHDYTARMLMARFDP